MTDDLTGKTVSFSNWGVDALDTEFSDIIVLNRKWILNQQTNQDNIPDFPWVCMKAEQGKTAKLFFEKFKHFITQNIF